MTSLLTHTVAHSTRPSFMPKANNQLLKKFFNLAVSWVKVVKNWTSFQKIEWFKNWSFPKMSITKNVPLKWYSSMKKKMTDSDNFWHRKLTLKVRILHILTTFTQVTARLENFLLGWLSVLGIKEGLVECATVWVKSWVILKWAPLEAFCCPCREHFDRKLLL